MRDFDIFWLGGRLACTVRAADECGAGVAGVEHIAAQYRMGRPPVLASSVEYRYVGLYSDNELVAVVVPVTYPAGLA